MRDEDARELLGGVSNSALYAWKKNPQRVLDVDRITRIARLIGIYKALHILYGDPRADCYTLTWHGKPEPMVEAMAGLQVLAGEVVQTPL